MTARFNPKDLFNCFICGREEQYHEDETFETVTLYEVEPYTGTITFMMCPECRKRALQTTVSAAFKKKYVMTEKDWSHDNKEGVEE